MNDLDNGDASLLNDESTNDSEEVVTNKAMMKRHQNLSNIIQ